MLRRFVKIVTHSTDLQAPKKIVWGNLCLVSEKSGVVSND